MFSDFCFIIFKAVDAADTFKQSISQSLPTVSYLKVIANDTAYLVNDILTIPAKLLLINIRTSLYIHLKSALSLILCPLVRK